MSFGNGLLHCGRETVNIGFRHRIFIADQDLLSQVCDEANCCFIRAFRNFCIELFHVFCYSFLDNLLLHCDCRARLDIMLLQVLEPHYFH